MEKLAQYLADSGKTQSALAAEVGVDKSVMSRFLSRLAKPGREVAVRIERVTLGAVPVASWSDPDAKSQGARA